MPLERYRRILRGSAKPRFFHVRSTLQKQAERLTNIKKCVFCDKKHALPRVKVKISAANDPTFCNALVLSFGPRGSAKTPAQVAAHISKSYKRGKKTLIISGDVAHGLPFLLKFLKKLASPVALVLATDPLYSENAAKVFNRIIDVFVLTLRWCDPGCAAHFGAENYVEQAQKIVKSSKRELVVRIPVIPGHIECDAKSSLEWLAKHAPHARVQLLHTHKPRALERAPELSRTVTITEFSDAVAYALKLGLDAEGIAL